MARLRVADDEAIAGSRAQRGFEHELYVPGLARGEARRLERDDVRQPVRGAHVHMHGRPGLQMRSRLRE
ncbi:MAG TPA: hypothetical protein VMT09_01630 [Steroidobacteraceae bacterium]|nr:hypothetical protein [Steroidobacteraceae bacterium]